MASWRGKKLGKELGESGETAFYLRRPRSRFKHVSHCRFYMWPDALVVHSVQLKTEQGCERHKRFQHSITFVTCNQKLLFKH
jgi:hypothetical protein